MLNLKKEKKTQFRIKIIRKKCVSLKIPEIYYISFYHEKKCNRKKLNESNNELKNLNR